MKRLLKGNKGLSLIEVVLSVAILSLVSISLLDMFIISTRTERKGFDYDQANTLVMEAIEAFDNNQDGLGPFAMFNEAATTYPVESGKYKKYYGADWKELPVTADPGTEGKPAGAMFSLTGEVSTDPLNDVITSDNSYYPASSFPVFEVTGATPETIDIAIDKEIEAGEEKYSLTVGGATEKSPVSGNLVALMNFGSADLNKTYTVNLTNNTYKPVEIYAIDAEDGKVVLETGSPDGNDKAVAFLTCVESGQTRTSTYSFVATVIRLQDNAILASNSTKKIVTN